PMAPAGGPQLVRQSGLHPKGWPPAVRGSGEARPPSRWVAPLRARSEAVRSLIQGRGRERPKREKGSVVGVARVASAPVPVRRAFVRGRKQGGGDAACGPAAVSRPRENPVVIGVGTQPVGGDGRLHNFS